MKITRTEFHEKLIDPNGTLKQYTMSSPRLGIEDPRWGKIIEEGAIQVTDDWTLSGSFCLNDGTFWGTYVMHDDRCKTKLKSIQDVWYDQLRFNLKEYSKVDHSNIANNELECEYESIIRDYEIAKHDYDCNFGEITREELLKYPGRMLPSLNDARKYAWYKEVTTKEYPFRVHISGNDDSSFSKFFSTEEDMRKWFEYCCFSPRDIKWFYDNMIFTN